MGIKNALSVNLRGSKRKNSLRRVTGYDISSDNAVRGWLVKQQGNRYQRSKGNVKLACAN
jgi:hypothetical protein